VGEALESVILRVLETKRPKNVKELVGFVQEQVSASFNEVSKEIKNLQHKGLLVLEEKRTIENRFLVGLFSRKDFWFWGTIIFAIITFISILIIPEFGTPLSYIRYALGFIFAAFFPGYCLIEALFPKRDTMDEIERFTFSVGLSFAVTSLVGLVLSFTPFGLTLTTALGTLGLIVIVLAIIAFKRRYNSLP
jgi:uncharacterized membrane protein